MVLADEPWKNTLLHARLDVHLHFRLPDLSDKICWIDVSETEDVQRGVEKTNEDVQDISDCCHMTSSTPKDAYISNLHAVAMPAIHE